MRKRQTRREPGAEPKGQVTRLMQRVAELEEQQAATSAILRAVAASPTNLQAVLEIVTESAAHLCDAFDAALFLRRADALAVAAHHGAISIDYTELPLAPDLVTGRAVLDRTPVAVDDLAAAGDEFLAGRTIARRLGLGSVLATPLVREGEALGALTIRRAEVRPFSEKQIALLKTFADQAVIAIENVRLFEKAQARNREVTESLEQQTAMSDILRVISRSPTDVQPVFETIADSAARLCNASFCGVFRFDGELIHFMAQHGMSPEAVELQRRAFPSAPGQGSAGARAILSGRVEQIPDVESDASYTLGELTKEIGVRSVISVPMLRDGRPVGSINIGRPDAGNFPLRQIELLQTFADQAVIAIENVRLFEEVRARTSELQQALEYQTATSEVLNVISKSPAELQPVLDVIIETAVRLCEADFGTIARERDGSFVRTGQYGSMSPTFREMLSRAPVEMTRGSITGRTLVESKVVHVLDAKNDPEYTWTPALESEEIRSGLGVPFLREGTPIGAIALVRRTVRPFTEKQVELVTTFADQAVIAIENARLFEEVQARTAELSETLQQQTATADVLKVISRSAFDLHAVFQTLLDSAARLCAADRGAISLKEGDVLRIVAGAGLLPEHFAYEQSHPHSIGRGTYHGRAALEGTTIHVADVLADPEFQRPEVALIGKFRAVLAVPIRREGNVVGVFGLGKEAAGPFSRRQVELVETFADQAAIAIENVRLFDQVQARTRELAKSLEELRTAQDRLVQTEKLASLGQLTAGIAHEIKNPLNFVNNFSSLSAELIDELRGALAEVPASEKLRAEIGDLTEMLKGNLEKVVEHGRRADSIVKNMLLHSRAGSGEHRPSDINAIVEESLNLAYHGARAGSQDFKVTMEKLLDTAAGDVDLFPQEITRVLLNLISNGFYAVTQRKAQADGRYEPILAASTRDLGDSVEIRIRDNGTGIPPQVKAQMFNPFFTTKPAGEGTGLGLSISHDIIVKQHAGTIEVDTELGAFTEFRIVLPRGAASLAKSGDNA